MDTDARVKLMVALGVTSAIGIGLRGGEDEYTYAGEGNRRGRRAATMTAAAARKYLLKQGWRAKDIDNPKPSSALGEPLPERYRAMAIESSLPAYQVSKRSQAKTARAWRALAGAAAKGRSARGRRAKAPGRLWKTVAGVRIYKTPDGEYIVAPDLDYPHGWYYTDDPQDAGGTAMIEGRRRGWGKGR